jgi:hypothetical protein
MFIIVFWGRGDGERKGRHWDAKKISLHLESLIISVCPINLNKIPPPADPSSFQEHTHHETVYNSQITQ